MAELVDAQGSGPCGHYDRGGSSPPFRTILAHLVHPDSPQERGEALRVGLSTGCQERLLMVTGSPPKSETGPCRILFRGPACDIVHELEESGIPVLEAGRAM